MTSCDINAQTVILYWEGRTIEVSYKPNWNGQATAAELHVNCIDPPGSALPVSQSGFRTLMIYPGSGTPLLTGDLAAYAASWLNEAAQDGRWRKARDGQRQLSLF